MEFCGSADKSSVVKSKDMIFYSANMRVRFVEFLRVHMRSIRSLLIVDEINNG